MINLPLLKLWHVIFYILLFLYGVFFLVNYQYAGYDRQKFIAVPSQIHKAQKAIDYSKLTNTIGHLLSKQLKTKPDDQNTNQTYMTSNLVTTSSVKNILQSKTSYEITNKDVENNSFIEELYNGVTAEGIIDRNMFAIYNLLPHLKSVSLQPRVTRSGRPRIDTADFVIGVPSAKRDTVSYLTQTLRSLVVAMNVEQKRSVLIVVYLSGLDLKYLEEETVSLRKSFAREIDSGLIEIVWPPLSYYPNFEDLKPTLGDSKERMTWRTKQVLDIIFLFMYAHGRGKYYIQLEDDVVAKNNFLTIVNQVLVKYAQDHPPGDSWAMFDFCQLGFIGKLFHDRDLPELAAFFALFYRQKPVDWLVQDYFQTKYCDPDHMKTCHQAIARHVITYDPPLFQHVGTKSSLSGKIQNLKAKNFEKYVFLEKHTNPNAELSTTLRTYMQFGLEGAYLRKSIFWALEPRAGDSVIIRFDPPLAISSYRIKSCHESHVSDCLYDTTLEVKPQKSTSSKNRFEFWNGGGHLKNGVPTLNASILAGALAEGYTVLSLVDNLGTLEGSVSAEFGPLESLRLKIHSPSSFWVAISEIYIEARG